MMNRWFFVCWMIGISLLIQNSYSQVLNLPSRPSGAPTGTELVGLLSPLARADREEAIWNQVKAGNIPNFIRTLVPVSVNATLSGTPYTAIYYVTPEYLCLGPDEDYFLMPMSPLLAQRIADLCDCNLPTRKMVNDIWAAAEVKLSPSPIPPSGAMITIPVFAQHNTTVKSQRAASLPAHPLGALVGGHKKDVVITPQLATNPGRVAIYGWHYTNGTYIQPLNLSHEETYADYSHGIRLIQLAMTVNGQASTIPQVLANSVLSPLLSDEGAFSGSRYPVPEPPEDFPFSDSFPASGRQLSGWTDRFTTPQITNFSPSAPGGDGYILIVKDSRGGIETTRIGNPLDQDYFVQCYLYCNYRPQLSGDGYERIGLFARDDGNGMFEGTSGGGIQGNNYALTWDSQDGRIRCLKTMNGTPVDLRTPVVHASSGWRKFRIDLFGSSLTFRIDDDVLLSLVDTTFPRGQFGIGYHDYFTTNTNILGTSADNFLADQLNASENIDWQTY